MENPVVKKIQDIQEESTERATGYVQEKASYRGVVQKESAMLALVVLSAGVSIATGYATPVAAFVSSIMALIIAFAISFKPVWAPTLTPAYALLEGMALGSISFLLETAYPNIVVQAVLLTFAVAIVALFVFGKGLVEVGETFKQITATAVLSVLLFTIGKLVAIYFFGFDLSFFDNGLVGVLIDLVIVGVATMSLFVDYQQIRETVEKGLPKEYEWLCVFSLLVTLIWLYLRILELLRATRR